MSWLQKASRLALSIPDPELAHNLALKIASRGKMGPDRVAEWSPREVARISFPNPFGIAAGFDKSAVAVSHWHRIGAGFVEIGTVTPRPQSGNPKPRLFRIKQKRALINRLGFNNAGAEVVAQRLSVASPQIPLGVNIGKNKDTPSEAAFEDYCICFEKLKEFASYICVNVSSPNTPGLRDLQSSVEVGRIVRELRAIDKEKPIFVKFSPDQSVDDLLAGVGAVLAEGGTGVTLTNTTLSREGVEGLRSADEQGGLSGEPLKSKSLSCLEMVRKELGDSVPIIASGGIMSAADAYDRLSAGANLVQIYTGMVFGGADFFHNLRSAPTISPK